MSEKYNVYRLTRGDHRDGSGRKLEVGDEIVMSEKGFVNGKLADRFELVEQDVEVTVEGAESEDAEVTVEVEVEVEVESEPGPEPVDDADDGGGEENADADDDADEDDDAGDTDDADAHLLPSERKAIRQWMEALDEENARGARDLVNSIDDPDLLGIIQEAEKRGKNRATVNRAIAKRLTEVTAD